MNDDKWGDEWELFLIRNFCVDSCSQCPIQKGKFCDWDCIEVVKAHPFEIKKLLSDAFQCRDIP